MKITRPINFLIRVALLLVMLTGGAALSGCGSSGLSIGQKLYMSDGTEFGTIVQLEENHQFENGQIEPGALVDYGLRIPGTPPQWIPQRSVERMVQ